MFWDIDKSKAFAWGLVFVFLINTLGPLPAHGSTRPSGLLTTGTQGLILPAPGTRITLSLAFNPPVLKGIKVYEISDRHYFSK